MKLEQRLAALEAGKASVIRWHRLVIRDGNTAETALTQYEAVHGPIAAGDGIIQRVIISPKDFHHEQG